MIALSRMYFENVRLHQIHQIFQCLIHQKNTRVNTSSFLGSNGISYRLKNLPPRLYIILLNIYRTENILVFRR